MEKTGSGHVAEIVKDFVFSPFKDFVSMYETILSELKGARGVFLLMAGLAAGWWLYVPIHELMHALGCLATGGGVSELRIQPLYGGRLLSHVFSFVVSRRRLRRKARRVRHERLRFHLRRHGLFPVSPIPARFLLSIRGDKEKIAVSFRLRGPAGAGAADQPDGGLFRAGISRGVPGLAGDGRRPPGPDQRRCVSAFPGDRSTSVEWTIQAASVWICYSFFFCRTFALLVYFVHVRQNQPPNPKEGIPNNLIPFFS